MHRPRNYFIFFDLQNSTKDLETKNDRVLYNLRLSYLEVIELHVRVNS